MGLAWFDAKAAKEFGASLANYFAEKMPVSEKNVDDKQFERKSKRTLTAISTQVVEFKKNNSLNVYKRAQLSNTFKWALIEKGYDDKYVNELTMWLVRQL